MERRGIKRTSCDPPTQPPISERTGGDARPPWACRSPLSRSRSFLALATSTYSYPNNSVKDYFSSKDMRLTTFLPGRGMGRGEREPAPQLRCTGNGEPRRGSRGLIYHAEARRWPCSSASCCASPTMGRRTTTSPMAATVHLRAGSGRRSLRPLASRAPSAPGAPSAALSPRRTG